MITIHLVLVLLSVICLALAALGIPAPRVQLGWLGLCLWALSTLVRA